MPFCTREHRELYRLLHDREPDHAPVKVRSVSTLGGNDQATAGLGPRSASRSQDPLKPFADGNCQFCGKALPIFARLRGARFCSSDHEANFHQRQTQETLERLAAGQRKQVSPGSVRIRQRTKPQAPPTVLHQAPAAPAALVWQKVDLSRNAAVPEVHIPAQDPSATLPAARQDCLPTSPGIWPTLPDITAAASWINPPFALTQPQTTTPTVPPSRLGQQPQIQIPLPRAVSHQASPLEDQACFTTSRQETLLLTAQPNRLEINALRLASQGSYQSSAVLAIPPSPVPAAAAVWNIRDASLCAIDVSHPSPLHSAPPLRSLTPRIQALVPSVHSALAGDPPAPPAWRSSAVLASGQLPPGPAPLFASGQPVRPAAVPVPLSLQNASTSLPTATPLWRAPELAQRELIAASSPLLATGKPGTATFVHCAQFPATSPALSAPTSWQVQAQEPPVSIQTASQHHLEGQVSTSALPVQASIPNLCSVMQPSSAPNWTKSSIALLVAASPRLGQPGSLPNRAQACAIALSLQPAEPRRRTRLPLERLRLPAIGSAFSTVIA
jgi:hypothetical protein